MRRSLFVTVLISFFTSIYLLQRQLPAQPPVVEAPVVSTTYIASPPPRQESIATAPSPQAVWVSGHWDRTPDKWNWMPGTWVQPPFANAYWQPGYWQHQRGRFVWEDAHWAAANQGLIVAKPVVVPPAYEEVQPAIPVGGPAMTWQPGHWEWRGTWVWIPGVYVESTIANAAWVPGQWVQIVDGSWRWSPGHWTSQV
jgi:hypothetical protein